MCINPLVFPEQKGYTNLEVDTGGKDESHLTDSTISASPAKSRKNIKEKNVKIRLRSKEREPLGFPRSLCRDDSVGHRVLGAFGEITMNKNLDQAIRNFEKAAEELATCAAVEALGNKIKVSVEEGRELMDRINWAGIQGCRAERRVLEAVALGTAMDIIKNKIAEEEKIK